MHVELLLLPTSGSLLVASSHDRRRRAVKEHLAPTFEEINHLGTVTWVLECGGVLSSTPGCLCMKERLDQCPTERYVDV